ncbi:MAG: AraD1 family protein [Bryobacteraceae bacterium]|jgi:hypothetical protein
MRLIQIRHVHGGRRTGVVRDGSIALLRGGESIYAFAQLALGGRATLRTVVESSVTQEALDYDAVYSGASDWRILPAMDHPAEAARCLVSGTGLTHMASAKNRDAMHAGPAEKSARVEQAAHAERASGAGTGQEARPTDSMRMYQLGVEGGRPAAGEIGAAPEWFYKGSGIALRAHGEPLDIPPHAEDGGEEPEIAGIYVIDATGAPRRIGMAQGNEFSDHKFEKRNYLNLAASKLMTCAIGPELVVDPEFGSVAGEVSIERGGAAIWRKRIRSGDAAMSHSLANLEHHHFKHAGHRRPGDVHVHFFGADAFSFGEGVTLQDGDVMQVQFDGFGRALRNPLRVAGASKTLFAALPL